MIAINAIQLSADRVKDGFLIRLKVKKTRFIGDEPLPKANFVVSPCSYAEEIEDHKSYYKSRSNPRTASR